ncbi:FAD-dependent monooxygenase [Rhodocyclus gracilis]
MPSTPAATHPAADSQSTTTPSAVDILIVGAGPAGMALASALLAQGRADDAMPRSILLIDRRTQSSDDDPRALALAEGSRRLLRALGAWPADAATPIRRIHVSQRGAFGRAILDAADGADAPFARSSRQHGGDALGHVLRYGALHAALAKTLAPSATTRAPSSPPSATHLQQLGGCQVRTIRAGGDSAVVTLDIAGRPHTLTARLVVHAEGESDAAATRIRDYGQCAIVAEVGLPRGQTHGGVAWERFTRDGPLALLPMGEGFSLVYTVRAERLADLLAEDDSRFLARLNRDFGGRFALSTISPRHAFPLALRLRRAVLAPREVWIGAAAQTLHPVAGQGFNLGLRDAWTLAHAIGASRDDDGTTGDPGDARRLARWAQQRRQDRLGTAAITDGLIRVFGSALPPVALLRGAGLATLDLCPPLRRALTRRMMFGADPVAATPTSPTDPATPA